MILTIFRSTVLEYKFFKSPNGPCNFFSVFAFLRRTFYIVQSEYLNNTHLQIKHAFLLNMLLGGFHCI